MPRKIEISHKTIIFTVFFLIGLLFLYHIKEIIIQFVTALFITIILSPTVKRLHKVKIPRAASVLIVYIFTLVIIFFSLANIFPVIIEQTANLASHLPTYLADLGVDPFVSSQVSRELLSQISNLPSQIFRVGVFFISNITGIITVLALAFYLLMSRERMGDQLIRLLGEKRGERLAHILDELEVGLGSWARGQLLLMALVGFSTYIGLTLLGMPYAVPLSVISALLEVVPYVGPILGAIPAVIIGFGISPIMGFANIALSFLIQQVESAIFVPKIMQRSVGIDPVATIVGLAIGFRLAGVVGMLLSVPTIIVIRVLLKHYQTHT